MSRSSEIRMTCPCGTEFPTRLYAAVNVTLEPALLYQLLAGTLNTATCPNCGRKAAPAQPFIYHDMRRGIFAYVDPREELSEEERADLLETLRRNYSLAVEESARVSPPRQSKVPGTRPQVRRRTPGEDLARIEPEIPPMEIILGTGHLIALVESLLEPEERLGRVALSTRNPDARERERLLGIARRMAEQVACQLEVEDTPREFSVWIYGPHQQTDRLARALRGG